MLGYYASPSVEVARFTTHGFDANPFLIDMATGEFSSAPAAVGSRLAVRQYDVRFPNGKTTLTGTLTIPPGAGAHPGVVYVSGSGATLREEAHWLDSLFISRGIAVLAYDKRGVGQSGGVYPGELASTETIATLAGDAAAAARFLAAQTGIDRSRVGFYGLSQGGWIIPQAVVRSGGAASWALIQSGPTVTQGESDTYANFAETLPASGGGEARPSARAERLRPGAVDQTADGSRAVALRGPRPRAADRHEHGDPARPGSRSRLHGQAVPGCAASAVRPDRLPGGALPRRRRDWLRRSTSFAA